ncbi:hypothetical protein JCM1840_005845 [Sporobolomyces johnsonii]
MDTTPSPDSIDSAPSALPSPPGSDTSITSWPATDVGSTATADDDDPAPSLIESSPMPVVDTARSLAPLDTQLETASVSSELEDETPTADSFATPVSPTWAVSKIPVSEGEDDGVSPISTVKIDGEGPATPFETAARPAAESKEEVNEGTAPEKGIKAATEIDAPVESEPSPVKTDKPAFILTKATIGGENETVSITQPSTPSANSIRSDDYTETEDGRTSPVVTRIMTTGLATPFLPDTQQFFASPTFTNHAAPNSAISPKTSAFFSVGVRSLQRGAFITELSPSDAEGPETTIKREPKNKQNDDEKPSSHSTGFSTVPLISPNGSSRQRGLSPGHRSPSHSRSRSHSRDHRHKSSHRKTHPHIVHSRTIVSASVPKLKSARMPASKHTGPMTIKALIRELKSTLEREPTAFYTFKGVLAEFEETNRENFETREQRDEKVKPGDFNAREEPVLQRNPAKRPQRRAPQLSLTHTDSESETEPEDLRHKFASRPHRHTGHDKIHKTQDGSRRSQAVPLPRPESPVPPCYPPHLSPRRHRAPPIPDIAPPPPPIVRPVPKTNPNFDFSRARNVDHAQIPHKGQPKPTKEVKRPDDISKKQGGKSQRRGMIGADEIHARSHRGAEPIKKEKEKHKQVVPVIERRHSFDSIGGYPAPAKVQRISPHGGKLSSSSKNHAGDSTKLAPLKSALSSDTKIQLYPTPTLRFAFFGPSGRRVPPPPSSSVPSRTGAGLNKENVKHSHRPLYSSPANRTDTFPTYYMNKGRASASGEKKYGERAPGLPGRDDSISFEFDDFF